MTTDASALLRAARRRAGLSQAELAERAGTSQPAVARRERGSDQPTLSTLRRLLYACGEELELSTRPLPPSPIRELVQRERRQIFDVLARSGARNPRLFGSVARGEDDVGSDVDLLVDFAPDESPAAQLMTVLGLTEQLTQLLELRVDVVSPATLRPEVLERAQRETVPL
jgi:predicted nucleotidyltransferase/DNA-binding XRE family transcriptional regulator